MKTPRVALDIITQEEALRLTSYRDSKGVLTIGWGHTKPPIPDKITKEEARELLRQDLSEAEGAVERLVEVVLSARQFGALVSFVFNVGQGNLSRSTLRRLLNGGDYEGAAREFRKWRKSGGKILSGLLTRRGREEQLFRMGS